MVVDQKLSTKVSSVDTVRDLGVCFNDSILNITRDYDEMIIVLDTYRSESLKNITRQKRKKRIHQQYQVQDETNTHLERFA